MTRDPGDINTQVCRILGVDPSQTESLVIRLRPRQFPLIEIGIRPTDEQLTLVAEALESCAERVMVGQ